MEMAGDFLIREVKKQELQRVAEIWLAANLDAHDFIPEAYWRDHLEMVRELLAKAWICVCEEEGKVLGFLGMNGDHIEGIFVEKSQRGRGIGKLLLDYVKGFKKKLELHVYEKNSRAVRFSQREKFWISSEGIDEDTGEKEYCMLYNETTEY